MTAPAPAASTGGAAAGGAEAQAARPDEVQLVNGAEGAPQDTVDVSVEAEDERDAKFSWRCRLVRTAPIQAMAAAWAKAHGVTPDVVGFEDLEENLVDLSRTPGELGWSAGSCVKLRAVPIDAKFAEGADDKAATSSHAGGGASPPPRPAAKAAPGAAATRKRGAAGDSGAAPKAPEHQKRAKAQAAPAAKQKAGSPAQPARLSGDGPVPEGDEAIVFQAANPKKAGSNAHGRYEKYKKATTVKQALGLGADKADIAHDFKKGFMKRG